MTVFNINLNKVLKSTALILIASALIACKGETSANTKTVIEDAKAVEKVVSQPVVETPTITEVVKEKVEPVTQEIAAAATTEVAKLAPVKSTPKPPADFSKLDSSKYKSVSEPFPTSSGEKVEVTELFWFGCGHCFALEPHIKAWLKNKPENATFKKVPAIFSKRWAFHAQAFYTMESLNVPDQAYDEFFAQIHVKKRAINDINALANFLSLYEKDKATVENAFNSFAVDSKVRNAIKITKASGARGVPAMIIDGKYLTSQSDAGGTAQMFDVVDKLVAKAASER